ncbi:DgyrCDS7754 [Dimorphilus gyrociliatus]|uniref:DgyrCDS7754 n=1 Tax=Dimorphilus gyrociliatus TaxID=2664684 RepID=A0A7I8VS64_9ANNE|nr:DgyrCDS7754 [Dimorphilus gyrociliatus]
MNNNVGISNCNYKEDVDDEGKGETQGEQIQPSTINIETNIEEAYSNKDLLLAGTLVRDAMSGRCLHFKTDEKSLRIINQLMFQDKKSFLKDPKNVTVVAVIALTVVDIIGYLIWYNLGSNAIRWSRVLRPLYLINFPQSRQVRQVFRNIRRTLPGILSVLVLYFCSLLFFSLMAYKLFEKQNISYSDGRKYFQNFFDGFWDLYVLVTSANNPDVMIPSYNKSHYYAIFFVLFLVINLFLFMSIVLAVIYNNYRRHLKNEIKHLLKNKQEYLDQAFNLLKTTTNGFVGINKITWNELLSIARPKYSRLQSVLLFTVLDTSDNGVIERDEFLKSADLLNIELVERMNVKTILEVKFPKMYNHKISIKLREVVEHRFFRWFFDVCIVGNAICIGFNLDPAEWAFLALFSIEIILKIYTYGVINFFKNKWNTFDFIVIFTALIMTIVEAFLNSKSSVRMQILAILLVLRVLRLLRIANSITAFKTIISTIYNIAPSVGVYGAVIFVFYYIYGILGMEIFQNRIKFYGYNNTNSTAVKCGNDALQLSEFANRRYCSLNFNNFLSSLIVLFTLTVVNQWHIIAQGFVLVTSKAARLFFLTFHVTCVTLLLNIFTAFVLEVFILEYTISRTELQSAVESRIKELGLGVGMNLPNSSNASDNQNIVDGIEQDPESSHSGTSYDDILTKDYGIRFKLRKRHRKHLITLLRNMFESELEKDDEERRDIVNIGVHEIDKRESRKFTNA